MKRGLQKNDSGRTSESFLQVSDEPGAKRRASRAGSRSVATLNAEQLARKRANDREAQRSIRQRTKEHIERLENRIRELVQGRHGYLEEETQRTVDLERELRELREAFQTIEDSAIPNNGSSMAQSSWSYPMSTHASSQGSWSTSVTDSFSSTPKSSVSESPTPLDGQAMVPFPSPSHEVEVEFDQYFENFAESMCTNRRTTDPEVTERSVPSDPLARNHMLGMANALCIPNRRVRDLPLRLLPAICSSDYIVIGIIQTQRSLLAAGVPKKEVLGPYNPSLKVLLYPDRSEGENVISTLIANMLRRSPLKGLPERVACLFIIYQFVQWQVAPSPETYASLPEWCSPRLSQILIAHPIWVSMIVFGKLRDRIITNQHMYATDEFRLFYAANININWTKPSNDVLAFEGDEVGVSEEFIRHCLILDNWSLDEPFWSTHPELMDCQRP